jgi:hypothetical protein
MLRNLLLSFCLLSSAALAQPSPVKTDLARELTRLLRFEGMFETYLKACVEPEGTPFDPKPEFIANPGSFGGLSPQSAYWPEVVQIYRRFQAKACGYATPEKFSAFFSERFATTLSEADLRAAIAFHSSPVGKRIGDATLAVNQDFQAFANKLMLEAYEVARSDYQRDIRVLIEKYKNEPK